MFFLHTPNGGFRTAMHILWFFLEWNKDWFTLTRFLKQFCTIF
jgi:hypothetical protein